MKKTIFLVLFAVSFTSWAQNTPTSPVQTPVRPATVPPGVISANPNQQRSILGSGVLSNMAGIAGNLLSNRFRLTNSMALSNAMVYSNLFGGGNIALGDVEGLLQNLQLNIEQTLPILASLTASASAETGAVNPGVGSTTANTAIGTAQTGVGAANGGLGNTTVTPGQNTITPGQNPISPNQSAARTSPILPARPILPHPGTPSLRVLPNGQVVNTATHQVVQNGQTFTGTLGTNTFEMNQQTYQLLLTLQNDLQQALPVLQNLSAGSSTLNTSAANANSGAGFTNRFTRVLQDQGVLLPTGR